MRERLIELIDEAIADESTPISCIADYLLDNGVIVPPCKVGEHWRDEDGNIVRIETVAICETSRLLSSTNMVTFSYEDGEDDFAVNWIYFKGHFTREEAEAALKGEGE